MRPTRTSRADPGPVDPNDLSGHEIVALKADSTSAPAAKWLAEHAANATVVSRSNASASLVAAAVAGAGLALLPCFLAEAEPALKRLTPDVLIKHSVSLVYRREVRLAEPVRVVIRFVIDVMRKHADLMKGTLRTAAPSHWHCTHVRAQMHNPGRRLPIDARPIRSEHCQPNYEGVSGAGFIADGSYWSASRRRGPPIVLLHSSMSSKSQWRELIDSLRDRYRLIAIDLLGYGESAHAVVPASATAFATKFAWWNRCSPASCGPVRSFT